MDDHFGDCNCQIWLNLLMDDHYFGDCNCQIWLNLLMDDHHFGYITILGINKERKKERKKETVVCCFSSKVGPGV
jgi:hypothetical protein